MLVRLKGSVLRMAILDSAGSQLSPAYEPWFEPNVTADSEEREKIRKRRPVSVSPSTSQDLNESQYAVVCSEKQAKVISLPSQTCIYKHSITETSFILRADVVQMSQGVCVACFCANGHIMTLRWETCQSTLPRGRSQAKTTRVSRSKYLDSKRSHVVFYNWSLVKQQMLQSWTIYCATLQTVLSFEYALLVSVSNQIIARHRLLKAVFRRVASSSSLLLDSLSPTPSAVAI